MITGEPRASATGVLKGLLVNGSTALIIAVPFLADSWLVMQGPVEPRGHFQAPARFGSLTHKKLFLQAHIHSKWLFPARPNISATDDNR